VRNMDCVANYEIKTECSVVQDDLILRIEHPKDLYRARIQNIIRQDYTTPFLLSLHLYFDAPTLDDAEEIAEDYLSDCLNMLAFTTGARFQRYRIRHIVDATPGITGMRSVLMWSNSVEHEDPQPFLRDDTMGTIQRLLEFDVPPAIKRAMRWYRFGINTAVPDDQFTYFWFAIEIIAEFQKSSEKVPDTCPRCQSPLYCESCKTNPTHRPYPKQAIRTLLKTVDKECDDAKIDLLDKTRNGLMHGSTLEEIERAIPEPHEHIVDILGRLLCKAIIYQFPREMFDGTLAIGYPSTYIHRTLHAIAHIRTVVPANADGDPDLNRIGVKMELVTDPPQSALPTVVKMDSKQYERLRKLSFLKGDHQETLRRVCERVSKHEDEVQALVLATDMAFIRDAIENNPTEEWQELFREILQGNKDK
jgi:Methylamine utilization protein MauJ